MSFNSTFFDRVLILAGGLRYVLGYVAIRLIYCDYSVLIDVCLSSKSFQQKIGEYTVFTITILVGKLPLPRSCYDQGLVGGYVKHITAKVGVEGDGLAQVY